MRRLRPCNPPNPILGKRAREFSRNRLPFVLVVKTIDHVRRHGREFREHASHHRMHDAQPIDDDDVAGAGDELEAFVAVIPRAVEPCQKSIAVVQALPFGEVAEENEAARLHVENVEDLGLVRDVLLEAESLARALQEDGVAERARCFDRVRLVLEQKPEIALKRRERADARAVERRGQLAGQDLLELPL